MFTAYMAVNFILACTVAKIKRVICGIYMGQLTNLSNGNKLRLNVPKYSLFLPHTLKSSNSIYLRSSYGSSGCRAVIMSSSSICVSINVSNPREHISLPPSFSRYFTIYSAVFDYLIARLLSLSKVFLPNVFSKKVFMLHVTIFLRTGSYSLRFSIAPDIVPSGIFRRA